MKFEIENPIKFTKMFIADVSKAHDAAQSLTKILESLVNGRDIVEVSAKNGSIKLTVKKEGNTYILIDD